jgi:hypothetical protein
MAWTLSFPVSCLLGISVAIAYIERKTLENREERAIQSYPVPFSYHLTYLILKITS